MTHSAGTSVRSERAASGSGSNLRVDPSVMPADVVDSRNALADRLQNSPLPPAELIRNLGLYLLPMDLKRLLFFADLYQRFLHVPGVMMEFGCRWGQNLATLQSLRSILEPFHHRRRIIGFDTFQGFPSVAAEDGTADAVATGAYSVTSGYPQALTELLRLRETQAPISEVQKFEIVAGDVSETLPEYLDQHPETIVAFAYFDLDLYQPTKDCLQRLAQHLTKGSVVGFDELNHANFPGETVAVREALGLQNIQLQRSPFSADECFYVV